MNRDPRQEPLAIAPDSEALALLEALLLAAGEAVPLAAIAETLGWTTRQVRSQLEDLERDLESSRRGMTLQWHHEAVQLASAPRFGAIVERFLAIERTVRLSEAALETLAIIAYRQPVTRAEIEELRGVDSSGVLGTLVARELIEVAGQRATLGNPNEYRTTATFLEHFGLSSLDDLPAAESSGEDGSPAGDE